MEQKIILIVHKPFIMFHWGETIFSSLQKNDQKRNITVKIIEKSEELAGVKLSGLAFLLINDEECIDSVIEQIINPELRIVLLFGYTRKYNAKISHIYFDNRAAVEEIIQMLHRKGRVRPAFFGVQKNDISDENKADAFAQWFPRKDIYHIDGDIEECFLRFYDRISDFDSVICANDLIAVYLCKRCRECGIDIPKQLYVVGYGGLWIAGNVSPRLTTVVFDLKSMADIALMAMNSILKETSLSSFDIKIKLRIDERGSTEGAESESDSCFSDYPQYKFLYSGNHETADVNIKRIKDIDSFFSSLSPLDKSIVRELVNDASYEAISSRLFITLDTTRYHVKKIYKALGIHTAKELRDITGSYKITI